MSDKDEESIKATALRAFFLPEQVGFHTVQPKGVAGHVVFYPQAHTWAIIDRLDAVLGPSSWSEEYGGNGEWVECVLRVRFTPGPDWVQRSGRTAGGGNWREDQREAFAKAAAKLGIGRYLSAWVKGVDYDGKTTPKIYLPEEALPPAAKSCGREMGGKILGLLETCVREGAAAGEKTTHQEAAQRLAKKYDYEPDGSGNIHFSRVQNRHAEAMLQDLNKWLAQIAAKGKPAQSGNSRS